MVPSREGARPVLLPYWAGAMMDALAALPVLTTFVAVVLILLLDAER